MKPYRELNKLLGFLAGLLFMCLLVPLAMML